MVSPVVRDMDNAWIIAKSYFQLNPRVQSMSQSSLWAILVLYILNMSLIRRGREDLKAAHHRINQMLSDYGDVVPRRDYEQLQAAYEVTTSHDIN